MGEDVFRWVIAIGVFLAVVAFVVQTIVILAMYRVTKATQDKLMPIVESITPILGTVRRFVDENTRKRKKCSSDGQAGADIRRAHVAERRARVGERRGRSAQERP